MGVGGIRGGRGPKGAKGASGKAPAAKSSGAGFAGKVGRAEAVEAPSGAVGSANVQAVDPLSSQAMSIARQLKAGQIASKEEATKKLVADILKEKLRMQSKALTQRIADTLQDDPRLNQALERLWSKG